MNKQIINCNLIKLIIYVQNSHKILEMYVIHV